MIEKWSLRLRIFLFFALIGIGAVAAVAGGAYFAAARIGPEAIPHLVLTSGGAAFAILGLVTWVWLKFDDNVARPIMSISRDVRAAVHADAQGDIGGDAARYLGFLAPAVREVTGALKEARTEVEAAVEAATKEASRQTRRLEAVLRDLRQGVLICNLEHKVLLYNRRALEILHVSGELGLGRSLLVFVAPQALSHAIQRLTARFESGRHVEHEDGLTSLVVVHTRQGGRTLKGRLTLTLNSTNERPVGYVIAFDDVTDEIAAGVWRDRLLHDVTADMRQRIASLVVAGDMLAHGGDLSDDERFAAEQVLAREPKTLAERLERLDLASGDLIAGAWPMSSLFSPTLLSCVIDRRSERREITCEVIGNPLWLHCDSASVVDLVDRIMNRVAVHAGVDCFQIGGTRSDDHAFIDLIWAGKAVPIATLDEWLGEPLDEGVGSVSGHDVLSRHKTDMWSEDIGNDRARVRLPLGLAEDYYDRPEKSQVRIPERAEFYDFDLAASIDRATINDVPLKALTFVVFDTETTGLEPARGDKVISIAGARVVNGRMLRGEVFNTFVHPGRTIPAASTKIHGITDAMVAGADAIEEVLPRFHEFVGDAVLVAHNAAFDMKFVTMSQDACGVKFDGPVLDTVLLAAHVFGDTESLTLDALADRFEVVIADEDRHTALGDALATAEVLLRLISLLDGVGVRTLRDAFEVSEAQAAIRRKQKKAY
ncbi:MAG: exonuclease domain-containing protein [Hyphomicrobiales bacterium]